MPDLPLLAAALFAMLPSAPSFAVNAKDKMATCKFGADDQKLQGAARDRIHEKMHVEPRRSAWPRGGPQRQRRAAAAAAASNRRMARRRGALRDAKRSNNRGRKK